MACRYLHISLSEKGVRCDNSELVVGVAIMRVDGRGLLVVIFSLGPVLVLLDCVHLTISSKCHSLTHWIPFQVPEINEDGK